MNCLTTNHTTVNYLVQQFKESENVSFFWCEQTLNWLVGQFDNLEM